MTDSRGITILLVLLIVSSLLVISTSIFNFVIAELRISGALNDSFYAVYAADEAMERALYQDRIEGSYVGPGVFTITDTALNGSCYTATITKTETETTIKTVGKYQCTAGSPRQTQRSFEVRYQ